MNKYLGRGQVAIDYIVGALGLFIICIAFMYFLGVFQDRNIDHVASVVEHGLNNEFCNDFNSSSESYAWAVENGYDNNGKPICTLASE